MQNFSQILLEAVTRKASVTLTVNDINNYLDKVKSKLPKNVLSVIYLTIKYELLSSKVLQDIMDASSSDLNKFSTQLNIESSVLQDLQKQLKSLKHLVRLIPQFQSQYERNSVMSGKLRLIDLALDFDTTAGRNAIAKLYIPLVNTIANHYRNQSSLDFADLVSAGMEGLSKAIDEYDIDKSEMPFKTFAADKIEKNILNDMNEYSHDLSGTNWYARKNYGDRLDAVSLDSVLSNDDEDFSNDHLAALGVSDNHTWMDLSKSEREYWDDLFKIIDSKFTVKECNIFYRFFGLGEFWGKKEKSKDIAKSYGMSEGNIRNSIINKILKYLKSNPKTKNILSSLRMIYNESLLKDLYYLGDKKAIYEALVSDDTFILLEEISRWNNAKIFKDKLEYVLNSLSATESSYIIKCLTDGFDYIDSTFKKNKSTIIKFLEYFWPTENFTKLSDVSIIEYMTEMVDHVKEHEIKWKN